MMEGNKLKKKLDAKMGKKDPVKGLAIGKIEIEKEDPEEKMMGDEEEKSPMASMDSMDSENESPDEMKKDGEEEMTDEELKQLIAKMFG